SAKLNEYGCTNDQSTLDRSFLKSAFRRQVEGLIFVKKSDDDIRIDGCHSSPRTSRIQLRAAFRPFPTPGIPIPRNSSKGSSSRTAETRTLPSFSSNATRSPAAIFSRSRNARGTVNWPLLVMVAICRIESPYFFHCTPYKDSGNAIPCRTCYA